MTRTVLGVIGGSGIYEIPGLAGARWVPVQSPWGRPSDEILLGELDGVAMAFLPRHGRGHAVSPSHIDYRANIDALKRVGVTDIVSLSAVGSLREDLAPGTFVLVDQFIDRTFARRKSFFGSGCVAHVSMADPVCSRLRQLAAAACDDLQIPCSSGGTYLVMEGPQFSTRAESELYRSWGCAVIGMTNMPEAKLAREAEICYATVAMVTDYDCWHDEHDAVAVPDILRVLQDNAARAQDLVAAVAAALGPERTPSPDGIEHALDHAILTRPEARDPELMAKLDAVAGRYLNGAAG